jgi:hypothetical protein
VVVGVITIIMKRKSYITLSQTKENLL